MPASASPNRLRILVFPRPVDDIRRMGRSTQGVIVMRLREGEIVSTLTPVVDPGDEAGPDEALPGEPLPVE